MFLEDLPHCYHCFTSGQTEAQGGEEVRPKSQIKSMAELGVKPQSSPCLSEFVFSHFIPPAFHFEVPSFVFLEHL